MKMSPHIQFVARIMLIGSLLAINELPFFLNSFSDYEDVFLTWGAIHGELCLVAAWLLLTATKQPWVQRVWSLILFAAASIAVERLFQGRGLNFDVLLILMAIVPTITIAGILFGLRRFISPIRLHFDDSLSPPAKQVHLKQLCAIVAGAAYLSFLVRQLFISERPGWLLNSGAEINLMLAMQSGTMGLLAAPAALIVLQPTRRGLWYLPFMVVVCAMEPILYQVLWFALKRGRVDAIPWTVSYSSIVIDSIAWYGRQLLPTLVLFALVRLSGVRVEGKK